MPLEYIFPTICFGITVRKSDNMLEVTMRQAVSCTCVCCISQTVQSEGAAISACRLCLDIVTILCILPTITVHKAGSSQLSLSLRIM